MEKAPEATVNEGFNRKLSKREKKKLKKKLQEQSKKGGSVAEKLYTGKQNSAKLILNLFKN